MDGSSAEQTPGGSAAAAAAVLPRSQPPRSTSTLGLDLSEIWREDEALASTTSSPGTAPLPPLQIAAAAVAALPLSIPVESSTQPDSPSSPSSPLPAPPPPPAPKKRSSLTAAMRFMGFTFGEPKHHEKTTTDAAGTKRSKSMGTINRDKMMKTSMTTGDIAIAAVDSDTETIVGVRFRFSKLHPSSFIGKRPLLSCAALSAQKANGRVNTCLEKVLLHYFV